MRCTPQKRRRIRNSIPHNGCLSAAPESGAAFLSGYNCGEAVTKEAGEECIIPRIAAAAGSGERLLVPPVEAIRQTRPGCKEREYVEITFGMGTEGTRRRAAKPSGREEQEYAADLTDCQLKGTCQRANPTRLRRTDNGQAKPAGRIADDAGERLSRISPAATGASSRKTPRSRTVAKHDELQKRRKRLYEERKRHRRMHLRRNMHGPIPVPARAGNRRKVLIRKRNCRDGSR